MVVGGGAFYERREVRDLLAYLRVAAHHGDAVESVRQCINSPFRFLGKAFVQKMVDAWDPRVGPTDNVKLVARGAGIQRRQVDSALEWSALVEELMEMVAGGPAALLALVVNRTRYIDWVKRDEGDDSVENDRAQSVQELLRTSARFATVESLLNYVDSAILVAKKQGRGKPAKGRVILSTIHKSKGLEWPHVFVAGCNDGVLPHAFGDPDEERRLMYVAITRARDNLVLSYVRTIAKSSGEVEADPSPFIGDAMGQVDEDVQIQEQELPQLTRGNASLSVPLPFR